MPMWWAGYGVILLVIDATYLATIVDGPHPLTGRGANNAKTGNHSVAHFSATGGVAAFM